MVFEGGPRGIRLRSHDTLGAGEGLVLDLTIKSFILTRFYKVSVTFATRAKVTHITIVNVMLFHTLLVLSGEVVFKILHKRQVL